MITAREEERMIKRMIAALDGSALAETALPFVERVARGAEAELILVRVVPPASAAGVLVRTSGELLPYMASVPIARPEADAEAARNERYEAERYLDTLAESLGERGIAAQTAVVVGDAAPTLIEEARLRGADLIALGTHGRSGLGRWIYGSVAEAVVARSPVPVFLARPWAPRAPVPGATGDLSTDTPILVPLDGTPRAERAIPIAAGLSLQVGTSVHLLQVVVPSEETVLPEGDWARDLPQGAVDGRELAARSYLTELVRRLRADGVRATASVEVDAVGAGIAREAHARRASLVVMATHAYAGLARLLARSVAQEVLHRVPLPLILLGPTLTDRDVRRGIAE
jgi:nucleotide-binding universal stress UspA family protein